MTRNLGLAGLLLLACVTPKHLTDPVEHGASRSRQLMVLAAGEARHIPDADMRLTRQLNISNDMLSRYGKDDAAAALREATRTLNEVGNQLTGHARVAGWVSVAQLASRAAEKPLTQEAAQRAVMELEQMPSLAERCDYVLGVAEEVRHALGAPAAIDVLNKSADWATGIELDTSRRAARLAFASALFNLDDYDAGATMLRKENDAVWSSDAMMRLAAPTSYFASAQPRTGAVVPVVAVQSTSTGDHSYSFSSDEAEHAAPASAYGKEVGFGNVFEGRTTSTASEPR